MLVGVATKMGVAVPARSMRSGLVRASLSMMRVPASVVEGCGGGAGGELVEGGIGEVTVQVWLRARVAAGGGGEEGPRW